MRTCYKCKIELIVPDNISQGAYNNYLACRKCHRKYSKQLQQNKRDQRKADSTAGVYGLYDKGELVYVGESAHPLERWHNHFYTTARGSKDDIGFDRDRRKDYEFKMILEEADIHKRRAREMELIVEHKPKLNYPYRHII